MKLQSNGVGTIPISQVRHVRGPQDVPMISMTVAATFWGWGRTKFVARFRECLHQHIRHVRTRKGVRLNLVDVIACAFPDFTEELVFRLAFDYILENGSQLGAYRKRKQDARRRGK